MRGIGRGLLFGLVLGASVGCAAMDDFMYGIDPYYNEDMPPAMGPPPQHYQGFTPPPPRPPMQTGEPELLK